MPTLSHSIVPLPKSWDEFEDISLSALKIRWSSPSLQRNGRSGQAQYGVDIYGPDELQRNVGVQCKLVTKLAESEIDYETKRAGAFKAKLAAFYFATSLPRDSELQTLVRLKSQERVNRGKFPIGILFWDDIIMDLTRNEQEFKRHYPQIHLETKEHSGNLGPRRLAILDLGFYGQNIKYYLSLFFGEYGQMANEDPLQLRKLCGIIQRSSLILMKQPDASLLSQRVFSLLEYVLPWVMNDNPRPSGWKPANDLASEIQNLCHEIQYSLRGRELTLYALGIELGRWNAFTGMSDNRYANDLQKKVLRLTRRIFLRLPSGSEIRNLFSLYNSRDPLYTSDTPFTLYHLIRDQIVLSGG